MPLDAAGYQTLLLAEMDLDLDANPTLPWFVSTLWTKNDDRAFDLTLQYLYTKADVVRWLLQNNWRKFDWQRGDVSKKHAGITAHLGTLLEVVKADIKALEAGILGNLSPQTAVLTKGTIRDPTAYVRENPFMFWFYTPLLESY